MLKDRIEMQIVFDNNGNEKIRLNLHTADLGILWLRDVPFSKGVKEYFCQRPRSLNEIKKYKFSSNEKLNKLMERMDSYIKYARQEAIYDMTLEKESVNKTNYDKFYDDYVA